MSSFLWLLFYLAPLLALTAAVFACFGWYWRRSDLQQRIHQLQTQIDNAPNAEANAAELHALRDELNSAQAQGRLHQDEAAKAQEATHALEAETTRLLSDLEQMRAAHAATLAELTSLREAPAPAAPPAASEPKPKRKRSTPAKPKASATAATVSLRERIVALETQLSAHQADSATLTQERDGWQQRIREIEASSPTDPTSLDLARRSLADSETRLATATAEMERLQNQTQVLLKVEAEAAALSDVPDDDLTQIKGIKKITNEQLRAHGIRTWRQIALWNDQEQRALSDLLAFKNRATREQWQEQARALHAAAHGTLL